MDAADSASKRMDGEIKRIGHETREEGSVVACVHGRCLVIGIIVRNIDGRLYCL